MMVRRAYTRSELEVDGVEIKWKAQITYLGVDLDCRLSFGLHINNNNNINIITMTAYK